MTPRTEAVSDPAVAVVAACHEPWVKAWDELDERMARSLTQPVRRGLEVHREATAASGLSSDRPVDLATRSERLLEYRRGVSALLEPLAMALEGPGPADLVARVFTDALEKANTGAQGLPSEVMAAWPEGALSPHPADGTWRRIGKVLARGVSSARNAGQARPIRLRAIALRHLGQDVAPSQDEAIAEVVSAWATWVGHLELAVIEWADAALPALIEAELPDDERTPELWGAIREAAAGLDGRLEVLLEGVPHESVGFAARAMLESCRGALEADLAVAGSFLVTSREGGPATLERMGQATPAYRAWDHEVAARMQLYVSILAILAGAGAVRRRVVERCREGSLSRAEDLLGVASELRAVLLTLQKPGADASLPTRISSLASKIEPTLRPALGAIPDPSLVGEKITEVADSAVEALLAVIRQAPASLTLHAPSEEPLPGAWKVETRSLPLQELARQSFDALRIERIRASTDPLVTAIGGVRDDVQGLPEVFTFAHEEALRELDSEEEGGGARALELLGGALEQMATSLETRVEDVNKVVDQVNQRLAVEIGEGSSTLVDRVGAGRMQAQLLAARSRVADLIAWVADSWGPRARDLLRRAGSMAKRSWEYTKGSADKVRALLRREPSGTAASTRAIQSLSEVQALVGDLPLVYQRLFTLDAIADPALLTGRADELESAMERWRSWRSDEGVPLLVRGRQGSGVTSFLNVLEGLIQSEGHSHATVSLDDRISDEAKLSALIAEALGLRPSDSLDEVAQTIFATDESSLPAAIVVDDLEHLYLRVPGGTDLLERLLTLMAETEPRIFWIGGITSSAWQQLSTAEPTAVSQADELDLSPLDREAMRAAILARHRRSGLDLRYEESETARARLRRRLRARRARKGFKQLLEDEFFDRLHRASGGHLGLALMLWLQSATFDEEDGVIMQLPKRPDLSVLDQLSLTQNFTLKAFLEHRTLTLDEHDRIFRLPRHESYQVLESLRSRRLVEEARKEREKEQKTEQSDIEVDHRYRIRPLLIGAVISHLQGSNIIH